MTAATRRRGAPLAALGLILVLWVLVRATMWQRPDTEIDTGLVGAEIASVAELRSGGLAAGAHGGWRRSNREPSVIEPYDARPSWPRTTSAGELDPPRLPPLPSGRLPPLVATVRGTPVNQALGHQLLWLAAISRMPLPPAIRALAPAPATSQQLAVPAVGNFTPGPRRWSGDVWLLLRRDGGTGLANAPTPPSYGASQVGALVRYRLDPSDARRPVAFARASAALERGSDREVALGLAARPLAGMPLVAGVELRVADRAGAVSVRPAAFVVTELAPAELPGGVRAEAYAQGGYVGGRAATAFVDGQLRVDRRVARIGRAELRVGAGVWGGAQEGASRLDLGPGATLGVAAAPGAARLALDWRFRIAGKAAPASGPALTLSAGF